ncbi:glycosyltransferase family 2 protein [Seleniivibrio woodruffii]|uniref:glycosyltransferase family 2 protein n=1 Tax=Seleniivibrio woodruffii TaxID=1078050 RepID=UPI0024090B3E|nr:glycosyltransferase family 2 protein [Seleniivibrio woodruffii]
MIDVLLSAYNGEKYLAAQLDSLLDQTYADMRIVIRDDGSKDSTPQIIESYKDKYPHKIFTPDIPKGNMGVKNSFFALLESSTAEYAMFCDQDDIWLPEKTAITLAKMKEAENGNTDMPVLVHTDLAVAAENLDIIAKSMFAHQKLRPENGEELNILALENVVTGCTAMLNRALADRLKSIPEEAVIHDWWAALTALKHGGKVVFVPEPTILYRQHGRNTIGAEKFGIKSLFGRLSRINALLANAEKGRKQAEALGLRYSSAGYIIRKALLLVKRQLFS